MRLRLLLLLCFITSVAAKLSHKVACETTQGTFVIAVHKEERIIELCIGRLKAWLAGLVASRG